MQAVAAFTDTYLPTVNGVTYTVTTWRDRWRTRGGDMAVVYPHADGHVPGPDEHPVTSLPFPFYEGFRLGLPRIPRGLDPDLVHVHTPFSMGLAGLRLARRRDVPLVASYHTPTSEYVGYLTSRPGLERRLSAVSRGWERRFFDRASLVTAPSEPTRDHLVDTVGVETPVEVVPNGVDTERFRPVDATAFRRRHGLDADGPLVGYTGRHGHEKRLDVLVEAAAEIDATVVLAGDGPARTSLEQQAADLGADVRFLGFLDRDELPTFYAALDVFAFPSPVETQGIVALEAMACGTPVVGADRGALASTIDEGVTGYHFETGDVADLAATVDRALAEQTALTRACLDRRPALDVDGALDQLAALYASL